MPDFPKDLITAKQAVEEFRPAINSLGAFYDAARRGKFPTYGCGRRIFASRAEVASALCSASIRVSERLRGKIVFASR